MNMILHNKSEKSINSLLTNAPQILYMKCLYLNF